MENSVVISDYEKMRRKQKTINAIKSTVYYVCGTILSLIFLFPLIYMFVTSGKSQGVFANDAGTFRMFLIDFSNLGMFATNYVRVLTEYDMYKYALNSIIYAVVAIVLNILVNGLAGYALSKFNFPGKSFFSFIILFLMVVPVETSIIPLYSIVVNTLGFKGDAAVFAVILPPAISIFNIFLFIQFFSGIPKEYEEAASLDGAGTMRIFFSMILPLSKPIIATVATFTFIGVWNDYLWPTLVLPPPNEWSWPLYPIQSALTTIQNITGVSEGEKMASLVITSIPIFAVYIAAQKYIVNGFGSAGLKL
ncbi:MAG: carbohydrate ABC transporter permease [Clostridiales bacterium]|nr:carbohydrate ABC transporter permease [Clostridiales bacterium]